MKHYIVKVIVTQGEIAHNELLLITACPTGRDETLEDIAEREAYLLLQRGDELEPSDSGFFDLGGEIHLEVIRVQKVRSDHVEALKQYFN